MNRKVLVIADKEDIRRGYCGLLGMYGYEPVLDMGDEDFYAVIIDADNEPSAPLRRVAGRAGRIICIVRAGWDGKLPEVADIIVLQGPVDGVSLLNALAGNKPGFDISI